MELRQYGKIVRRHLWVVILLPLVALIAGLLFRSPSVPFYQATVRLIIDVPPLPASEQGSFDPRYYAALATEYLMDDFSGFVTGDVIADSVSRRLTEQGITVPPGVIQGSTSSEKVHRLLTLRITWHEPDEALAIAEATVEALREESPKYFARLLGEAPQLSVFDGPKVIPLGIPLRQRLDLPIRLLLGLIAGLGLAFLLDYLDDTIRETKEVEALGIPVLGHIPAPSVWERLRRFRP
jgi:capsular polysaccharide biosynthesis protein